MKQEYKILQTSVTNDNAIALADLVSAKLLLKQFTENGYLSLQSLKDSITVADIEYCIDKASEFGFDGIELLLIQMESEENSYLQKLKKRENSSIQAKDDERFSWKSIKI